MKKLLAIIFLMLMASAWGIAQTLPTAAQLVPPTLQLFDNAGNPCAGCLLWSFVTGTQTPLATYTDSSATVSNTNPIVLNAAGRANVWIKDDLYKFILEKPPILGGHGTVLWTENNVSNIAMLIGSSFGAGSFYIDVRNYIKDYSPTCDIVLGAGDCTLAIQTAIDAAEAMTNPGTVYLYSGVWQISAMLRNHRGIRFLGSGDGGHGMTYTTDVTAMAPTEIKWIGAANGTMWKSWDTSTPNNLYVTGLQIRDIRFNANSLADTSLWLQAVGYSMFENIFSLNHTGVGIRLYVPGAGKYARLGDDLTITGHGGWAAPMYNRFYNVSLHGAGGATTGNNQGIDTNELPDGGVTQPNWFILHGRWLSTFHNIFRDLVIFNQGYRPGIVLKGDTNSFQSVTLDAMGVPKTGMTNLGYGLDLGSSRDATVQCDTFYHVEPSANGIHIGTFNPLYKPIETLTGTVNTVGQVVTKVTGPDFDPRMQEITITGNDSIARVYQVVSVDSATTLTTAWTPGTLTGKAYSARSGDETYNDMRASGKADADLGGEKYIITTDTASTFKWRRDIISTVDYTAATNGTTTLTGTGTSFLKAHPGDKIYVTGETVRTIAAIASDTSLTVTLAFSTTASALQFTIECQHWSAATTIRGHPGTITTYEGFGWIYPSSDADFSNYRYAQDDPEGLGDWITFDGESYRMLVMTTGCKAPDAVVYATCVGIDGLAKGYTTGAGKHYQVWQSVAGTNAGSAATTLSANASQYDNGILTAATAGFHLPGYIKIDDEVLACATLAPSAWSITTTYNAYQYVLYSGTVYYTTINANLGHQPNTSTNWWTATTATGFFNCSRGVLHPYAAGAHTSAAAVTAYTYSGLGVQFHNLAGHEVGDEWIVQQNRSIGNEASPYDRGSAQPPPLIDTYSDLRYSELIGDSQMTVFGNSNRNNPLMEIKSRGYGTGSATKDVGLVIDADSTGYNSSLLNIKYGAGYYKTSLFKVTGIGSTSLSSFTIKTDLPQLKIDTTSAATEAGVGFYDAGSLKWSMIKTSDATVPEILIKRPGAVDTYAGVVNTSGVTVTWVSGDEFPTFLSGTITIGTANYTIDYVQTTKILKLTTTAGTQNGEYYYAGGTNKVGTVTTAGDVVTWKSGDKFFPAPMWTGYIWINGVKYLVDRVNTTEELILTASAGTQVTPVAYYFRWSLPVAAFHISDNNSIVLGNTPNAYPGEGTISARGFYENTDRVASWVRTSNAANWTAGGVVIGTPVGLGKGVGSVNANAYYTNGVQNVFDVRSYGALGDGTTDDGPAINLAIIAASATRGVVYLPPGSYHLHTAISLVDVSNVTLRGAGKGISILTASQLLAHGTLGVGAVWGMIYADSTTATNTSNITIEDLSLIYGVGNYSQNQKTIFYGLVNNFTVQRCYIDGGYWESIYHHGATVNAVYYDCLNTKILNNHFGPDGLGEQVSTNSVPQRGILIDGNFFDHCSWTQIAVRGQDVIVTNNDFYRCLIWAISIGEGSDQCEGVVIANNTIREQGYGSGGTIGIRYNVGYSTISTTNKGAIISNNTIVDLVGGTGSNKAIQIQGNAIVSNNLIAGVVGSGSSTAIYIVPMGTITSGYQTVTLIGNNIQDTDNANKWDSGISVAADDNAERITLRMMNNYVGDIEASGYALFLGNAKTFCNVYTEGDVLNGYVLLRKGAVTGAINTDASLNNIPMHINNVNKPLLYTMGILYANLGTPPDGTMTFCPDCAVGSTCTGSGTGSLAIRIGGVWVCK
jgi:hypothetical protein